MDNSKNWIRGAVATMAVVAAGAVQADEIWGPAVSTPAGGYVSMGNTYGTQSSYSHKILSSAQEISLSSFLAANPLDQSGILSLYFADDGDNDSEYFQYRLNGTGDWIGGLSSAYEVDGSVCYSGTLSSPTCQANYFKFDINLDGLDLAALLAPAGVPTVQIRVNPDYEYQDGYSYQTTYSYTLAVKNRWDQWTCPNGGSLTWYDGAKQCKVTTTTKVPKYVDYKQDFYFKGSIFTAYGDKPTEVPEPATFGLLGLGMIGVGLARRRRAQKA